MDSNKIDHILEKYWEGESSLQDEAMLREYFSQEDIPAKYESIRPMFQFFKTEQASFLDGNFDERLTSKLKAVEATDNIKPRRHSLTVYIRRAAAVAAIFIGVLFVFNKVMVKPPSGLAMTEKAEAKLAYAEAKAALMLISKKLNKGTSKAESGIVMVRKATDVIKE